MISSVPASSSSKDSHATSISLHHSCHKTTARRSWDSNRRQETLQAPFSFPNWETSQISGSIMASHPPKQALVAAAQGSLHFMLPANSHCIVTCRNQIVTFSPFYMKFWFKNRASLGKKYFQNFKKNNIFSLKICNNWQAVCFPCKEDSKLNCACLIMAFILQVFLSASIFPTLLSVFSYLCRDLKKYVSCSFLPALSEGLKEHIFHKIMRTYLKSFYEKQHCVYAFQKQLKISQANLKSITIQQKAFLQRTSTSSD